MLRTILQLSDHDEPALRIGIFLGMVIVAAIGYGFYRGYGCTLSQIRESRCCMFSRAANPGQEALLLGSVRLGQ